MAADAEDNSAEEHNSFVTGHWEGRQDDDDDFLHFLCPPYHHVRLWLALDGLEMHLYLHQVMGPFAASALDAVMDIPNADLKNSDDFVYFATSQEQRIVLACGPEIVAVACAAGSGCTPWSKVETRLNHSIWRCCC